ncbi:MAG TPA: exopolysaccharide biosynthesis polyprenyl glycosylphosphotransferase [Candidatus Hydrogenedentes bacterium]|nr:exopolysaccharide biosynthesis polyprenyl glycosylphosphotransferase [Candidatus Hydrogenedentota bacterium]HRT19475.1 exopolysaccharide biosynthesis polyprenyl glycosylphosphotransferase [Candidatus Hydrogenedentota bacterium]HRT63791.1 exopolysaccharide biosynthesis polyprenyl glycosylphosphotransferase [Candidatus Hydrogenedentota bacterium]
MTGLVLGESARSVDRTAWVFREERQIQLLYFLTDMLMYWLALSLATLTRWDTLAQIDFLALHRDRLICLIILAAAMIMAGSYRTSCITDRFDAVYYAVLAAAIAGLVSFALTSVLTAEYRTISRRELVVSAGLGAVLIACWRYYAASVVARFQTMHRYFFILGSPINAERIAKAIANNRSGGRIEAQFVTLDALKEKVRRRKEESNPNFMPVEDAIIALEEHSHGQLDEIIEFCREHCRRTFLHPTLRDVMLFQRHHLQAIAGIPLIEVASQQAASPYLYLKRLIDLTAAATGLLAALPICMVTALAIKLTSPGPILYVQERLGRGGKPFRIYKFRSMTAGPELRNDAGHVLATENDPRITPVGRFIRKHRIDEIPQLFNVLRGDMSLIGPRPAWREFYETNRAALPLIDQRLAVRPGLTCLSHVLGTYFSEAEDRLLYDLVYINTLSLMTDLRILISTIRIVLSGKGAQ